MMQIQPKKLFQMVDQLHEEETDFILTVWH